MLSTIRCTGIAKVNDLRGEPTFACICGCKMFKVTVMWDEDTRAVGWYDLAQECIECGTVTTAPTEIDGDYCA
jgi:hypothetical protein